MGLSQPERVRAARGAVNMSLSKFAEAISMGRSTLVRIENGERQAEEHELERISKTSGLPVGFFLVDDLDAVLDGAHEPNLAERVTALEDQVTGLRAGLAALSADSLRRTREQRARDETDRREEPPGEGP